MKKITVVMVDRANYGRLKPVLQVMQGSPEIELQIICTGSMLLDRFGKAVEIVKSDGFEVTEEIYIELEGSLPTTMVKSMGLGIIELGNALQRLAPDFAVIIGDRYEAFSAAIAAAFQNICLVHIQGGEVTGSIDESTRHAISKIAHYHFPSTEQAGRYLIRMGEHPDTVFPYGCPSADVICGAPDSIPERLLREFGVGPDIDIEKRFIFVLFHPVTTEYQSAEAEMNELLEALKNLGEQVIMIWPNIDAGADGISQAIRCFREKNHTAMPLHVYKNFKPDLYIPLLKQAACLVGNSSSFIRDASFIGTPVVLVGNRQDGRECSHAVVKVPADKEVILTAIKDQIAQGAYPPVDLYGEPGVSQKIVDRLLQLKPYTQKRLAYLESGETNG